MYLYSKQLCLGMSRLYSKSLTKVMTPFQVVTEVYVTTSYHIPWMPPYPWVSLLQSSSFADPSPHVSDNSLDSQSQGLINRGSPLISPSSTTASSPPANKYFNSKRETNLRFKEDIVPTECPHLNAAPNDRVLSPRTGSKGQHQQI